MVFYLIVTLIAIIVFIVLVVYINYSLNSVTKPSIYPPVENACPDFWLIDSNGNCKIPDSSYTDSSLLIGNFNSSLANSNPKTYGYNFATASNPDSINFNDPGWNNGNTSLCNKKIWANTYSISWDGISNYNGKC